jgi:GNAT superfamily N-acetyltransferase
MLITPAIRRRRTWSLLKIPAIPGLRVTSPLKLQELSTRCNDDSGYRREVPDLTFAAVDPTSTAAAGILREYFVDIVGRHHAHPATSQQIDDAIQHEPSADLCGKTGVLIVATRAGVTMGCGGLRFVDRATSELTRVFVRPDQRGAGVGEQIVTELEQRARDIGHDLVRLDTRSDLSEARRLYSRLGYTEVVAFNSDPYAQHWLAKRL